MGLWPFSQNQTIKNIDFCMMVEQNGRHHLGIMSYLGKILIWGLRESKCQNRSLGPFFETGH